MEPSLVESIGDSLRYVNAFLFVTLAVVAFLRWRRHRGQTAAWATITFAVLAFVTSVGLVIPQHSDSDLVALVRKIDLAILVLFPYCLYRFSASFSSPSFATKVVAGTFTTVVTTWTFVLPYIPESGDERPGWFDAYLIAFLAHWTVLSVIVAVRLWRGGRRQPGVIRSRMRLLASASVVMTVALLIAGASAEPSLAIITRTIALLSGILFFLGFAPPQLLRTAWRSHEQEAARAATIELMQSTSIGDLETRFLPHVLALVGGRAAALVRHTGEVIAVQGMERSEASRLAVQPDTELRSNFIRLQLPFGWLFVVTSRYTPYFGSDELAMLRSIGAYVGMTLDRNRSVEALRGSEAELKEANAGLRHLTDELQSTNKELREAEEVKSQFLAMAAHELKTPLSAISGFAYTMLNMWDQLDDGEKHKFVGIIDGQTTRLTRLVEDLLMLSRIESGVLKARPQPILLSGLIKQTIRELGAEQIKVVCEEDLAVVADDDHLKQIVINYVSNAMKYGAEPITVSAHRLNGFACLSVCDSGGGVPPEFVPRLFERFSRANERSSEVKGTGLGLSIVMGLARAQGGEAWYEPNDPTGACFKVKLPVAAA